MVDDYENFKSWFGDVLAMLFPHRHAGLAILLITFPLLERYLRQRAQIPWTTTTGPFAKDLVILFANDGTVEDYSLSISGEKF